MGMNTISGMHVTKRFPDVGQRFKGPNGEIFEPAQLPTQFELIYPPHDPEVPHHELENIIPGPPHLRRALGASQFPRHVGPGPAPSYLEYQRLCRDIDRLNYVMEWVVVELHERQQRDGLAPRHFIPAAEWHQQEQQDPLP